MRTRARNRIQESEDETLGIEALRIDGQANNTRHDPAADDSSDDDRNTQGASTTRTYVGAGSYF